MAKRKKKGGGYAQRKNQEAQARQRKEQGKAQRNIFIGGLIIIAAIFGVVFLLQNDPPGGGSEPAASTVLEGERPLAALEPAARNGYFSAPPEMVIDTSKDYEAVLVTEEGEMRIRLFDDEAPLTVNNFVFLANQGYYDNTTFHRVLDSFMAQAGDPTGTGTGGPGYTFADEVDTGLSFDRRGLLAMANAGPGTNGSQFFITFVPTPHLDGGHTIFGELIEGDEILSGIRLRNPQIDTQPGDTLVRVDIVEIES